MSYRHAKEYGRCHCKRDMLDRDKDGQEKKASKESLEKYLVFGLLWAKQIGPGPGQMSQREGHLRQGSNHQQAPEVQAWTDDLLDDIASREKAAS